MERREFLKATGAASCLILFRETVVLTSCASALDEANNILKLIAPLGDGIAAIVSIADPAIAIPVGVADKVYDAAVLAVENYLANWATASAAAQPGILGQAQAATVALSESAAGLITAARVQNPATVAEVGELTGAITSEVSALLTVIPEIGAVGVSTAPTAQSVSAAVKRGKLVHRSAKEWRGELVKRLRQPTGLPFDAERARLADHLSTLELK